MKKPFFTILIPTKGRHYYLHDAVESVVSQNFDNIEIIVSNNGAEIETRDVIKPFLDDIRIQYVEQHEVLDMSAHWDKLVNYAKGKYLLILTDRSVLKAGSLKYLYSIIIENAEKLDVISWPWDLYYDHLKILTPFPNSKEGSEHLNSNQKLLEVANGLNEYPYFLPRGLNSAISSDFITSLKKKYGQIFSKIAPDFTFAYLCLLNTSVFLNIKKPLFISQGLQVSNGGNSYTGSASVFLNSLNQKKLFKNTPHQAHLVQNIVHEDFLSMVNLCQREDILKSWNRSNYFIECYNEIDKKYEAGLMPTEDIFQLEVVVQEALAKENKKIIDEVRSINKRRSFTKKIVIRFLNRNIPLSLKKFIYKLYLVFLRNGGFFSSVLMAANYKSHEKN